MINRHSHRNSHRHRQSHSIRHRHSHRHSWFPTFVNIFLSIYNIFYLQFPPFLRGKIAEKNIIQKPNHLKNNPQIILLADYSSKTSVWTCSQNLNPKQTWASFSSTKITVTKRGLFLKPSPSLFLKNTKDLFCHFFLNATFIATR